MTHDNKKTSTDTRSGIGTLNENSLHAEIINSISQPGDQLEAEVEGYYIDILRENKAIEVQTRNIGKIAKKVLKLAEIIPVEIIFPIQKLKFITKMSSDGKRLGQRKSPKQGRMTDLFDELVRASNIFDHPSVSFTVLMIEAEEIWKDDGLGSWRRKGWSISERKLIKIFSAQTFHTPEDLLSLLPRSLPSPFTNRQLAEGLRIQPRSAGKITYTLRKMKVLEQVGKHGNSYLFEII